MPETAGREDVLQLLRAVGRGRKVMEWHSSDDLVSNRPPQQQLTQREVEVLRLVADGYTNAAIARRLSISQHTVAFHVGNLFGKFGASSRTQLAKLAREAGYLGAVS